MTKEQAFKILGLEPTASKNRIKLKYANCTRRAKFDTSYDIEAATKAFDTIMGYTFGNFEPDEAYNQKGINKKKIESFFYLYRRSLAMLLFSVIAVGLFFALWLGDIAHYDYILTVIGRVEITDRDFLSDYYTEMLGIDEVLTDRFAVGPFSDGSITEVGIFKLYQDMASGDSDIYIVSDDFAKFLSSEGAVKDLSVYFDQFGISPDDKNILWWYGEKGEDIAAAYRFGNSNTLNMGYGGEIPEYFCIPFRVEVDDMTAMVVADLNMKDKQ